MSTPMMHTPTEFSMDLAAIREQLAVISRDFDSGRILTWRFPLAESLRSIAAKLQSLADQADGELMHYPPS